MKCDGFDLCGFSFLDCPQMAREFLAWDVRMVERQTCQSDFSCQIDGKEWLVLQMELEDHDMLMVGK